MSLLIAYVHGGMLHEEFARCLSDFLRVDAGPAGRQLVGGRCEVRGLYVADSRNQCCKSFKDARYPGGEQPEWLLFLDTDIVFKPQDVYALVDAAHPKHRPIVGGLYFGYLEGRPTPVWRKIYPELDNGWGTMNEVHIGVIEPIDAVGMGFTIIHRSVIEAFPDVDDVWKWFGHDLYKGQRLGEDLTFCHRAAKLGFKTYGDSRIVVGHIKPSIVGLGHYIQDQERNQKEV